MADDPVSKTHKDTKPINPSERTTQDMDTMAYAELSQNFKEVPFEAAKQVGSYRLIRRLGKGGFGTVWEAEEVETGRRVAMKVLTQLRSASGRVLARFKQEGRLAASLNHPNCVYIFGAEEIDGYPVIIMELMRAGTLQNKLDIEKTIPYRRAVDYILDVIDGLEAAQAIGIIHRDVKPANCFLDEEGKVKIGDFGLAKTLKEDTTITDSGMFLGTPSFSSPEQVRGRDVDFRTDLYAVGATLYTLLTGNLPYEGQHGGEIIARVLSEEPAPFMREPEVPTGLQQVVLRSLRKEKEKRYASYQALRTALLPYSSRPGLTVGQMGKRLAAYFLDGFLIVPLTILPAYFLFPSIGQSQKDPILFLSLNPLIYFIPDFLYFFFFDWLWGKTPGKFIFGLQIITTHHKKPSAKQILIRTFVYSTPGWLLLPFAGAASSFLRAAISTLIQLLIVSTMRKRNGYAGVHELASGTRVVALPEAYPLHIEKFQDQIQPSSETNFQLGPYKITHTVWEKDSESLLEGSDEVLKRKIWIHRHSKDSTTLPANYLFGNRTGLLRWLQGSSTDAHWHAYQAPTGVSFMNFVRQRGKVNWYEMRGVLLGLADGLECTQNQNIEMRFTLQHVWIDESGRGILLDFPAFLDGPTIVFNNWRTFLHHVLVFGLEGKILASEELINHVPMVPLPESASAVVQQLCEAHTEDKSISSISKSLDQLRNHRAIITTNQRLMPLIIPAMPIILPLIAFFIFLLMFPNWSWDYAFAMNHVENLKKWKASTPSPEIQQRIEATQKVLAYSYAKAKTSHSWNVLEGMHKEAREVQESAYRHYPEVSDADYDRSRTLIGTSQKQIVLLSMPLSVITSFLFVSLLGMLQGMFSRVPVPLSLFGMTLQTKTGKRISRFRGFLRAIVTWLPVYLFPILFLLFVRIFRIALPIDTLVALMICILISYIAGLLFILFKPERGIQDAIVGTFVVPK